MGFAEHFGLRLSSEAKLWHWLALIHVKNSIYMKILENKKNEEILKEWLSVITNMPLNHKYFHR